MMQATSGKKIMSELDEIEEMERREMEDLE
jgi:hypothetical protein